MGTLKHVSGQFQIVFIAITVLTTISCSAPIKDVKIHNPTDQKIKLVLNGGEEVTVPSREQIVQPIKFGQVSVAMDGKDLGTFKLDKSKEYFFNPTKGQYYIYKHYFFTTEAIKQEMRHLIEEKHDINGQIVQGDITKLPNEVFIPKTWKLDLDNDIPRYVNTKSRSLEYTSISQLMPEDVLLTISQVAQFEFD